MKKLKILNLYAGIGGNRKLWGDEHEITAVEYDPQIAWIYKNNFPNDNVIVADAHQYLLDHYNEFDFIWSSPPCPSHSIVRKLTSHIDKNKHGYNKPIFPDMRLYEEILFLQEYFKGGFVVENVKSWYKPFIEPQLIAMHFFWSNFKIKPLKIKTRGHYKTITQLQKLKGIKLSGYTGIDKRKLLRNCVEPKTGLHILKSYGSIH